jgi:hypothetical protein
MTLTIEQCNAILESNPEYRMKLKTQMNDYLQHEQKLLDEFDISSKMRQCYKNAYEQFKNSKEISIHARNSMDQVFKDQELYIMNALAFFPIIINTFNLSMEEHELFFEAFVVIDLCERIGKKMQSSIVFTQRNVYNNYLQIIQKNVIPILTEQDYVCKLNDAIGGNQYFTFMVYKF